MPESKPCLGARLRAELTERHAAFALQTWALFERALTRLEEEVHALRAENRKLTRVLKEREDTARPAPPPQRKRKRTNQRRPDTAAAVEVLTENSSDSENEWKLNVQPKVEEECEPVNSSALPSELQTENSEPELQTENSSDSEDEREQRQTAASSSVKATGPRTESSDPWTENSSESEPNCEEKQKPDRSLSKNRKKKKAGFVCSICHKSFNYKSVLKMHELSHGGSRPFECSECGSSFTVRQHLYRHLRIHKRNRPSGCEDSAEPDSGSAAGPDSGSAAGPDSGSAVRPDSGSAVRPDSGSAVRPDSGSAVRPGSGSAVETQNHISAPTSNGAEDALKLKTSLTKGLRKEHLSKRPKCSECSKTFSNKGNLQKHIRNMHKKRPLLLQVQWRHVSCSSCDKRFRFKSELTRHEQRVHRSVDKNKPYQCHVCLKSFRDKQYVEEHVRVHTGEKPYRCAACGKSFTFRKSYNVHMKTHEGL